MGLASSLRASGRKGVQSGRGDLALQFPRVWGSGGFNFQGRPGWAKSSWVMGLASSLRASGRKGVHQVEGT